MRRRLLLAVLPLLAGSELAMADDAALFAAATAGDIATLTRLVDAGQAVDARDGSGRTALLLATRADQPEVARVLIELGADVNARTISRTRRTSTLAPKGAPKS